MTNFATQVYLSYKGLFLWLNWPGYISNVFVRPVLVVAMFAFIGRFALDAEAAQGYIIGMAAFLNALYRRCDVFTVRGPLEDVAKSLVQRFA